MGSYTGGKWQSLPDKLASARRKNENPRRGGKRATPAQMETEGFRQEIARQAKGSPAKPKASVAKAAPAKTPAAKSSIKRSAIPKATTSAGVQDVKNDIKASPAPMSKPAKKDIKLGIVGRTGGKWHLGKKVGKG